MARSQTATWARAVSTQRSDAARGETPRDELGSRRLVAGREHEAFRDGGDIGRFDLERGATGARDRGRDDRGPLGHRLDHGQAEALHDRDVGTAAGLAVDRGQDTALEGAGKDDAGSGARRRGRRRRSPAARADHHQGPGHGQLRPRLRVGLHEAGEVLPGLERAHREQVRPLHPEALQQRLGARAVRRRRDGRHPSATITSRSSAMPTPAAKNGIGGRLGRDDDEGGRGAAARGAERPRASACPSAGRPPASTSRPRRARSRTSG